MNFQFRLQLWLVRSWPFRALALVLSKHVPESKDFGDFGDLRRNSNDTRILQEQLDRAEELSKYGVVSVADMARVQTLFDEAETAHLKSLCAKCVPRAKGFGPWDSYFRDGPRVSDDFMPDRPTLLKTNDEFEKLKARRDEHGLVRRTPEQLLADQVELARCAVKFARHPILGPDADALFRDLPPAEAFKRLDQLQEREDRRHIRLIRWSGSLALISAVILAVLLLSK